MAAPIEQVKSVGTLPADTVEVEKAEVPSKEQTSRTSRSAFLQLLSVVLLPFLIIRLFLAFVGVITVYYILPLINRQQPIYPNARITHFPDMLWLMWDHFDSGFYLNIAHSGYWGKETLHGMSNWAFFPLYPLLIRLFAFPFGSGDDTFRVAGVVVSNIAALFAAIYLYKLTEREWGSSIASRAVLYLALFPMSFYLSAIYTESLFLALTVSCIYYARTRRWWVAGVLGGLAALTRPQGVLLLVIVGWEYWQSLADQFAPLQAKSGVIARVQDWGRSRLLGFWRSLASWRTWLGFATLLLIPLGLGLFCLYAKWKVGSFLAFEEVEHYGWGRSFTNPFVFAVHMLHHPRPISPYDWNFYGLNMTVMVAFFLLLIPIFRKLPPVYGIFALLFLLMPLTSGETNSLARYYIEVFPVFMILGWWSSQGNAQQRERRHTLLIATFALLLSLGMVMFTLGVYSMS